MRYAISLLTVICALVTHAAGPGTQSTATDLWVSHLTRFADTHSELTEEQRAIVLEGRDLVADGLLGRFRSADPREAAAARTALASFKTRAASAFSRELYAEAFVRPPQLHAPARALPMVPNCDCNPGGGECLSDCVTGSCRAMPEGCGTFGLDACFGLCQ